MKQEKKGFEYGEKGTLTVDWGDRTAEEIPILIQADVIHTYINAGTYTIVFSSRRSRWWWRWKKLTRSIMGIYFKLRALIKPREEINK